MNPSVAGLAEVVRDEARSLSAAADSVRDQHLAELLATWARERELFLSRIGAADEIPTTTGGRSGPDPPITTRARMLSRRVVGGDGRVLQSVRYLESRTAERIQQRIDGSLPGEARVLAENLVQSIHQVVDDITTRLGERVEPRGR
jgi:hypothetical protein